MPTSSKGGEHTNWGNEFKVDVPLARADASNYDGLVLPGGVMNPDKLRINTQALDFVRDFDAGKPVAAICHGPWVLIDAGVIKGRELTSYHSIRADLEDAGAKVVDREVVVDNGLVTSRSRMISRRSTGKWSRSSPKAGIRGNARLLGPGPDPG